MGKKAHTRRRKESASIMGYINSDGDVQLGRQRMYETGFLQQCAEEIVYNFEYLQQDGQVIVKDYVGVVNSD